MNVHAPYAASYYCLCVDSPGRALSDALFTLSLLVADQYAGETAEPSCSYVLRLIPPYLLNMYILAQLSINT